MVGVFRKPDILACGLKRVAHPLLDLASETGDAPLVDQEGQPGSVARRSRPVIAENQGDLGAEVGRLLDLYKGIQRSGGLEAAGAHLASHENVEPPYLLSADGGDRRHEREVLRLRVRAMLEAAGDSHVEFPRKIRELPVAQERLGELARDRRGVEQLVCRETGDRTPGDVRDVVPPSLKRHEPDRFESIPDFRYTIDLKATKLYLLPRGDVGESGTEFAADVGERAHLQGVGEAVWHPHSHHEVARRLPTKEDSRPLQSFAVAFLDGLPSRGGEFRHVLQDVQTVLFLLVALDLVQSDDDVGAGGLREIGLLWCCDFCGHAPSRQLHDHLNLRPAGATTRARPGYLADCRQTAGPT